MDVEAARAWFIAGTMPLIVAGAAHAVAAIVDTSRPTFFTPVDDGVQTAVQGTGIRLRRMFRFGSPDVPSMWRVWLGIHISHGVSVAAFGVVCLLIALHDYTLVQRIPGLQVLTLAFGATYVALSLHYWFYGPLLVTGSATLCFVVAAALAG